MEHSVESERLCEFVGEEEIVYPESLILWLTHFEVNCSQSRKCCSF